jgi:hypothetical protein
MPGDVPPSPFCNEPHYDILKREYRNLVIFTPPLLLRQAKIGKVWDS